jgi:hypothetical protein
MVRHARGPHVELEDQLCVFSGAAGERSPDRMDSLVWSLSPFLDHDFNLTGKPRPPGVRRWAAAAELERMTADPATRFRTRPGGYDPDRDERDAWSADSFAPRDDDGRPERPNVRAWH